MTFTTQGQVRKAFWQGSAFKRLPGKTQNDYPTDVRVEWCDFVEMLRRDGHISEALAQRVTL